MLCPLSACCSRSSDPELVSASGHQRARLWSCCSAGACPKHLCPPCEFSARMLRKGCSLPDPDGGKGRTEGQRAVRHLLSLWGNFLLSSLVALKLLLMRMPARHLTGREEGGMARRASCPPVELASAPQVGCSPWHTPSLLHCKCDGSWM